MISQSILKYSTLFPKDWNIATNTDNHRDPIVVAIAVVVIVLVGIRGYYTYCLADPEACCTIRWGGW
jgi:uncharacterized membrane protein